MKHIKEYNTHISKVEELSEYLQEFFDDFNITEVDPNLYEDVYPSWEIYEDKIYITFNRTTYDSKIKYHLDKILPNIEKRMNCNIEWNFFTNPDSITIVIYII